MNLHPAYSHRVQMYYDVKGLFSTEAAVSDSALFILHEAAIKYALRAAGL